MTTPRGLAWIKPWMVVIALTVVAAGGATGVYFAGEAQHRRDRDDILRWEARVLPVARDATALVDSLRATLPLGQIMSIRLALERDLNVIVRPPLPEIVRPPTAAYIDAFRTSEAALRAIGTPSFETMKARAKAAFATAAAALQSLVCRAHLGGCASP